MSDKKAIQLRLLNEVSTKLQSLVQRVSEPEVFYQEILSIIHSRFAYHSLNLWKVETDQSSTLQAQIGAYQTHLKTGHRLEAGSGIMGQSIRTGQPYLCQDVKADPHFSNLQIPVSTQSQLTLPIMKGRDVIAVFNIESDRLRAFDEEDVLTLEAIASQIAVAISNLQLIEETRDFNKKLQSTVLEKTQELRDANSKILEQQKLLQKENRVLKTMVSQESKSMEIIGKSPALLSLISMVDKIAPTSATVLLQGESGTGKELIAKRLHRMSDRAERTYVTVNCGALQESLLESELFGHEKGAFTGAVSQKLGLCEMADGGTLFMDEIGELSLGIQSKLLRFLQEGEFYRIGGKKPIRVDVRVVSATNRDLEVEVKENRFREDLFYRLNTITLRMPPLRKRKEDIPLLVEFFLRNSRFGGSTFASGTSRKMDPRVMEVLTQYQWPGNIRELQNTIERLKILSDHNEIKLEDIPFNIRLPKSTSREGGKDVSEYSTEMTLEDLEKGHILKALTYFHGNKTKTAHSLGVTIKTLYNKLHRYGLIQNDKQV